MTKYAFRHKHEHGPLTKCRASSDRKWKMHGSKPNFDYSVVEYFPHTFNGNDGTVLKIKSEPLLQLRTIAMFLFPRLLSTPVSLQRRHFATIRSALSVSYEVFLHLIAYKILPVCEV